MATETVLLQHSSKHLLLCSTRSKLVQVWSNLKKKNVGAIPLNFCNKEHHVVAKIGIQMAINVLQNSPGN